MTFFFQIGQVDSSFSYPFQPACFCFFFYSASVDSCNFGAFSAHVCWRTGWLTSLFIFPSFLMCVDMWVHITAAHFLLKQGRIAEWQRGQRLLRGDCAAAFFFSSCWNKLKSWSWGVSPNHATFQVPSGLFFSPVLLFFYFSDFQLFFFPFCFSSVFALTESPESL